MLLKRADLDRIVAGDVDLAFRRWKRPTVKTGGTLTTVVGVLAIDAVDQVDPKTVSEDEARRAGFDDRAALMALLEGRPGDLYRVQLRYSGEDPRHALREQDDLSVDDLDEITMRLDRYDAASRQGPWTRRTLELIESHPETLAATLAEEAGWERAWFKTNVRKLKALGLTESLKVGYRISPRGKAYLKAGR